MNIALARYPLAKMDESERPYDEIARLHADAGQPDHASRSSRRRHGRVRIASAAQTTTGAGRRRDCHGRAPPVGRREIQLVRRSHSLPDLVLCPTSPVRTRWPEALTRDRDVRTLRPHALAAPVRNGRDRARVRAETASASCISSRTTARRRRRSIRRCCSLKRADAELEPLLADVRRRLEQTGQVASRD